jgi:hypothetical protein
MLDHCPEERRREEKRKEIVVCKKLRAGGGREGMMRSIKRGRTYWPFCTPQFESRE